MSRTLQRAVLTAAALAGAALVAVPALARQEANVSRKVIATDLKFTLTLKKAPPGTVTFLVNNKGRLPHDFKIAGKKTPVIKPGGNNASLKVTLKRGKYTYICTVPGHAAAGMRGVFTVG
jgi:plastocyanin